MTQLILTPGDDVRIDDIGLFRVNVTADVRRRFLIRGSVLDRPGSTPSPVAAKPATNLELLISGDEALKLAVRILQAATEAGLPLPKEVSFQE